jgi:hypothetical protein
MYIRTRDGLVTDRPGNLKTEIAASHVWPRMRNIDLGLGQPAASVPACTQKPAWFPLLKHYFSPKTRLVKGHDLTWESTPKIEELNPAVLNPGYFFTTTRGLARDPSLDKKLKEMIANLLTKRPPFNVEPFTTFVDKGGKIRAALVDLSTDTKLVVPTIAEFDSTSMTQAGSLAKIGLLYAAYQHRFDLNVQGRTDPKSVTADRIRELKTIYDITQDRHSQVLTFSFNADFRNALDGVCHNCDASKISRSLKLSYVSSALWQSGLYDCRWGGIWVGAHYNEWDGEKQKWECDFQGNCTPDGCHGDPKGSLPVAITALSVATFFTLLAQGRLIDEFSSQKLKDILIKQPDPAYGCSSRFKTGLTEAGRFTTADRIYSKIGITQSVSHEGALIDRTSIGKKYVAVLLTISNAGKPTNGMVRQKLITYLDELIRTNP